MNETIHVLSTDSCKARLVKLISILQRVIECESAIYAYGTTAHATSVAFTFLRNVLTEDKLLNIYLKMITEACYRSELMVGFGTKFICMILVSYINCMQDNGNLIHTHNNLATILHAFTDIIPREGTIPTRATFSAALEDEVNDFVVHLQVMRALDAAGLNGVIHISKDMATHNSIERVDGYNFTINSPFHSFKENEIQLHKCKCLLIDGIIEQVSEIHSLLEEFAKRKEPLVLFALGFGDDVLNTLQINFKRNALQVYPIKIPSEVDCINMLADLQVVTGTRFISALQGEIIQMAKYTDLAVVDYFAITKNSLTIKNDRTNHAIDVHVSDLRKRVALSDVHDLGQLLQKRIRALTSSYVNIRIAARSQQEHLQQHEEMSQALRYATSIITSGVWKKKGGENELVQIAAKLPHEYLSVNGLLYAATVATTTFEMLQSVGAACLLD